jgi:hypothetical protein
MKRHINMGSVISGTMRPEDLIPAFVAELEGQKPLKREHKKLIKEIDKRSRFASDSNYLTQGDAELDLGDLFDALNKYCAPYFYFGAHPGDGSDYGYWLSDSFEYDFDGLKVNGLEDVPKGYSGEVLVVNDHGNMTLYSYSRGRKHEIWGIV